MLKTNHLSNYNEEFSINIKNILCYKNGNLIDGTGGILKTLKNPLSVIYNKESVSDNTIYISGKELYNVNTNIINTISIEQEENEKNWEILNIYIKLIPNEYTGNKGILPNSFLQINDNIIYLKEEDIDSNLNQLTLKPLIGSWNKLDISVNFNIHYLLIECWVLK